MGLIKSNHAPATAAPFSMRDIEAQAQALILRARHQADQLLAAAQTEGAAIRQKSYDSGFAAGREDGLKKGTEDGKKAGSDAALAAQRAKLEQLVASLSAAMTEIDTARSWLESNAASEVIKLAIAIARRVTKLQGSLDPSVLTENVRQAMRLAVHATDVRIAIHPTQKQALSEVLTVLRKEWPKVSHIDLIEDTALAPGGCRIITAMGEVDADLDRQIDRIAADLLPNSQGTPT